MYIAIEHIWDIKATSLSLITKSVIGYANTMAEIEQALNKRGYTQDNTIWTKVYDNTLITVAVAEIPHLSLVKG